MSEIPTVEKTLFTVFERRAVHHHNNSDDELPDTEFALLLNIQPEKLGIRIKIIDEYREGTAAVDVAVQYYWQRDLSSDDNLNWFIEHVAIPQVLTSASTLLIDTARAVTSGEIPFYGLSALDDMVERFRGVKRPLSEILAESTAHRASMQQGPKPE